MARWKRGETFSVNVGVTKACAGRLRGIEVRGSSSSTAILIYSITVYEEPELAVLVAVAVAVW